MKTLCITLLVCGSFFSLATAQAADFPGSKDPPNFKRFEGSEIIHYVARSYDQYLMARNENGFEKTERIEGALTRFIYLVPEGHTSLELFRNYQQMLSEAGLNLTFELVTEIYDQKDFYNTFYFQAEKQARAPHESHLFGGARNPYYMTASGTIDGNDVTVALLTAETLWDSWEERGLSAPYKFTPGQVIVGLDVVTAKAMQHQMVTVKAADMAEALATKGSVDLYGIYFDIDKTDLKPESGKTIEEVANLLKIDRTLRLEISGHTDNTGNAEHNMTLSQGRAQAVVKELVTAHGIDGARLQATGYGDTRPIGPNDTDEGRAGNRRVELRKM